MNGTHLLVRTPAQYQLESPAGYLQRVSQANGYDTPRSLLAFAGMDRDEAFTTRLNIEKLAAVLGVEPQCLHAYEARGVNAARLPALCGMPVLHHDLAIARTGICPQCVAELGFAPAWFDLTAVDACPTHRRRLVMVCPACKQALRRHRPGLLTCQCGADLAGAGGEPIEADHAELLGWIVSKFTDRPDNDQHGMPAEWLGTMSVERLLRVVSSFASLHAAATGQVHGSDAQRSARLLSRWPENLYVAIAALIPANVDGNGSQLMRANAESVYRTWVKNLSSAPDMAFVRGVLGEFDSAQSYGSARSLQVTGVPPVVRPQAAYEPRRSHQPDESARARRSHGRTGQPVQARVAAKQLGLPVSVLQFLNRAGALGLGPSRRAAFSAAALLHVEGQVEGLQILPQGADAVPVKLMTVLRRKFGYIDGKGELVAAVLSGTMPIIGKVGPGFAGLVVDDSQAATFIARARRAGYAGTFSSEAAAAQISCDPTVIEDLSAQGLLEGQTFATGLRIAEGSISAFVRRFRFLASIGKEHGASARALLAVASSAKVPVLFARRSSTGSPQAFLRVEDVDALVSALQVRRNPPQESGLRSVPVGDSITFQATADALECTPTVVARLIELGHLSIHESVAGRRVDRASVDSFLTRFRSVVCIARHHGVGPTKILKEAARLGIYLLAVARGSQASPQYFMRTEESVKLTGPYETTAAGRLRRSLAAKARRRS